jgi:hypothetical protein
MVTVESQLQLMRSVELKCLKPHTDVANNMQSMVAIYIFLAFAEYTLHLILALKG